MNNQSIENASENQKPEGRKQLHKGVLGYKIAVSALIGAIYSVLFAYLLHTTGSGAEGARWFSWWLETDFFGDGQFWVVLPGAAFRVLLDWHKGALSE